MIKIISSEDYYKLTGDIDYWKARALEEEHSKIFYETLYKEEKSWNMLLMQKYDELKEQKQEKATFISLGEVKSLSKAQKIAEEVKKAINSEHHCDKNCFAEHVLPAIQSDYDSIDSKNRVAKYLFINYWYDNLVAFYPWLKRLYSINGKIRFK